MSSNTTLIEPFAVQIDFAQCVMADPDVHHVHRASDMRGYYAEEASLKRLINEGDDPLHYETYEKQVPQQYGHLLFCVSKLQPGVVGEECFMTKGHYHTIVHTGEIYLCIQGEGLMLMKTSAGEFCHERMGKGQMVYVPPYWAHRSVNTGNEPLTTFCVWPADAGHNYGDIVTEGFPKRVMLLDGKVVIR